MLNILQNQLVRFILMKLSLYNYFPYFYLPILMVAYIAGNAVIDLCVVISGLLWLIFYRNNFFKYEKQIKVIFILLFIFYFSLLFSSLFSNHFPYSMIKASLFIRFILFGLFFYEIYKDNLNKFSIYFNYILILLLLIYIDVIIQLIMVKDIFGFEYISHDRLSGPFGDELILGSFIFIFGSLYVLTRRKYDLLFYLFIFFSFVIVSLTGERVAFIKFIIFLFFIIFYTFFKKKDYRKIKIFLCFLFFIFVAYSFLLIKSDYFDRHSQFFKKFVPGSTDFILYTGYYAHYTTSINIFIDNPIVGSGFRSFRKECKKYENYFNENNIPLIESFENSKDKKNIIDSFNRNICTTHPHNFYLEIIAETGLIGITLFLLTIYLVFKNLIFFETKLFFIIYFFPFISTGSIFHGKNSFLFVFILLSLLLIDKGMKIKAKS